MNEDEFKEVVRQFLGQWEFKVKDLEPRPNLLTPDFEVTGTRDSYIIELKMKGDDPEEVRKKDEELRRGGIVGTYTPMGPRNRLSGLIHEGMEQMKAWDPKCDKYRVIWLHSSGRDAELLNDRFQATLFGAETLTGLNLPGWLTCYYFHDSAFYRWRNELDGAVLTRVDGNNLSAILCINTLSDRLAQFRNSELCVAMSNGLLDPEKLDGIENGGIVADCEIDRKDSEKVLSYLQGKYGLDHLQAIPMNKIRGEMRFNEDESD